MVFWSCWIYSRVRVAYSSSCRIMLSFERSILSNERTFISLWRVNERISSWCRIRISYNICLKVSLVSLSGTRICSIFCTGWEGLRGSELSLSSMSRIRIFWSAFWSLSIRPCKLLIRCISYPFFLARLTWKSYRDDDLLDLFDCSSANLFLSFRFFSLVWSKRCLRSRMILSISSGSTVSVLSSGSWFDANLLLVGTISSPFDE